MKTLFNRNTGIAAFAAVVIVGLSGLTLERGHGGALPRATIEVGPPEILSVGNLVIAQLPTVYVHGKAHAEPRG